MKTKLLFILICCFSMQNTHAGFIVKSIATNVKDVRTAPLKQFSETESDKNAFVAKVKDRLPHRLDKKRQANGAHEKTGWQGIVSIICAGLAIATFFGLGGPLGIFIVAFAILSVLAFVFGLIGVKKRHKNRGLALAGLIIGGAPMLIVSIALFLAIFF